MTSRTHTGDIPPQRANVARIYDFLLGGRDNNEEDRLAAEQVLNVIPDAAVAAWDNREFLGRAVRFLASEAGIRQFIDIGTGLPTRGNVHSVAQQCAPAARVVYVDYDPEVITHARAILSGRENVTAIEGDLRSPENILRNPELRALINLDEPVAILLVAVLHFIRNDENPHRLVSQLRAAMVTGSYLVMSHVTSDHVTQDASFQAQSLYDRATAPAVPRTRAELTPFFDDLEIIPPGLVNVAAWRAEWMATEPGRTLFYAGVGHKLRRPEDSPIPRPKTGQRTSREALGARLRSEREKRGWSHRRLAQALSDASAGICPVPAVDSIVPQIRRWERGAAGVGERYRTLYCIVFGMGTELWEVTQ